MLNYSKKNQTILCFFFPPPGLLVKLLFKLPDYWPVFGNSWLNNP